MAVSPSAGLRDSPGWITLTQLATAVREVHLRDLFATDADRFANFSLYEEDFLLDYSKQRVTPEIMAALHALWPAAVHADRKSTRLNSSH